MHVPHVGCSRPPHLHCVRGRHLVDAHPTPLRGEVALKRGGGGERRHTCCARGYCTLAALVVGCLCVCVCLCAAQRCATRCTCSMLNSTHVVCQVLMMEGKPTCQAVGPRPPGWTHSSRFVIHTSHVCVCVCVTNTSYITSFMYASYHIIHICLVQAPMWMAVRTSHSEQPGGCCLSEVCVMACARVCLCAGSQPYPQVLARHPC